MEYVKGEFPIRQRDASGQLVAAGYQWLEERAGLSFLYVWLVEVPLWLATFWFGAYTFASILDLPNEVFMEGGKYVTILRIATFLICSATTLALGWLLYTVRHTPITRRRAIIFHKSGGLTAPYGLADRQYFASTRPLSFNFPSRIVSIETRIIGKYCPVNIHFSDGLRLLIDTNSDLDGARTIAIQLTNALQELRTEAQRPPDTSQIVIN